VSRVLAADISPPSGVWSSGKRVAVPNAPKVSHSLMRMGSLPSPLMAKLYGDDLRRKFLLV
jgi:hypothetical protein